jgi:ABC-type amino acid transport substrate-binding protein
MAVLVHRVRRSPGPLFVLCTLVAACASCAGPAASPAPAAATPAVVNTFDEILRRGELRAGYHVEPPSITKDPHTGKLGGAFIRSVETIAAALKVKATFVEVDLANFSTSLEQRECDVSLGPTFKTIGRAQTVAFTNSLYYLGYDAVVKKGTAAKYPDDRALDRKLVRVAVRTGSPIDQYVHDHYPQAQIVATTGSDLTLPLQAVSSGQADVGFMNEHTVEAYVKGHPEVVAIFTDHSRQMGGMAWAVRREDQQLLNFLNTSIEYLIASGQMEQWERESHEGRSLRHTAGGGSQD